MSEQQRAEAAPEDDTPAVEQEAPQADEAEEPAPDTAAAQDAPPAEPEAVVELAREMGWSPKAEWRGDPNAWRPAKDYIKRGPEIQRELRQQRDRERADFEQRIARIEATNKVALDHQRAKIEQEAWHRIRAAAATGDLAEVDRANDDRIRAHQAFAKQVQEAAPPQQAQAGLDPAVVEFASRNEWYNRDPGMTGAAISHLDDVNARFPNLPLASALTMVEAAIKRDFPHRFKAPNGATPHAPPQVEGGGLRSIKTRAAKDWNSLPPEAKRAGAKFVEDGLFKTKEAYAADYWAQE